MMYKINNKVWKKPEIIIININDTKSGNYDNDSEGSLWFINWGSGS